MAAREWRGRGVVEGRRGVVEEEEGMKEEKGWIRRHWGLWERVHSRGRGGVHQCAW